MAKCLPGHYSHHQPRFHYELKSLTANEECKRLIDLSDKYDLEVPQVGYELMAEDESVVAEAELAWPLSAVAIILDGQKDNSKEFKSRGWEVLTPDVSKERLVTLLALDNE